MSVLAWFPINPTLTRDGQFSAFSFENNASELKPVPLDASADRFSQFKVLQSNLNIQTAAKLGVGVNTVSGGYNSVVFSYEAMLFTEKVTETPLGGQIYGTRWGAGLRVMLRVTDIKSKFDLNFGAIAASSELGLSRVEYEIHGIGIRNPEILSVLPGPSEFNFSTYKKIIDAVDTVKGYMAQQAKDLTPQPFQVFLREDVNQDVFTETRAILFAAKQITQRKSLAEALETADAGYNRNTIRAVYARFNIFEDSLVPTREQKKQAEEFVKI